jgi:predicted 2-oxoglutarate/Fe(II)-dependent dioxygenase YbiX
MAYQATWYYTQLNDQIIDSIEQDLTNYGNHVAPAPIHHGVLNREIRNSEITWVSTSHWVAGYIWHYIQRANRENFLFDIENFENEVLQYTTYGPEQFYSWHVDSSIGTCYKPEVYAPDKVDEIGNQHLRIESEVVRKLSFSLQLSSPEDYGGGQLQFHTPGEKNLFYAPKSRGALIIFDSTLPHRVKKVTHGVRKTLVGWVSGPRWR